jgi:hypothetical protein
VAVTADGGKERVRIIHTLLKILKKWGKFSSYIKKFRRKQEQIHI